MGSSNAGKSSLLNALNDEIKVAKTRKKSGKTQSLHFYHCKQTLNVRRGHKRQGMLIDSPGYGHTYVPVKVKNQFKKLMTMYLSHAVRLNLVLMLVDARTGLKTSDRDMLQQLYHYQKPVQLVISKVDRIKTGRVGLSERLERTAAETRVYPNVYPEIYLLSAKHGFGIKELRARVA